MLYIHAMSLSTIMRVTVSCLDRTVKCDIAIAFWLATALNWSKAGVTYLWDADKYK